MAKYKRLLILVVLFLAVAWFGMYPEWVERAYSTGIYPHLAALLRGLWGWVPFSAGDVFYFAAGVLLLTWAVILVARLLKREWSFRQWLGWGRRFVEWCLVIILVFNLAWALNYNRLGIAYQLRLDPRPYGRDTLQNLIDSLLIRVNDERRAAVAPLPDAGVILREAREAYRGIEGDTSLAFIHYTYKSIKPSMYGEWGNYMGFLGYYNPFTGEAQVNCTVPAFTLPYTACHEMAHQLGYASESEANFVGYLAAVHSTDPWFRYSAYFDLFSYANRELFLRDSAAARRNYHALDTLVRADYHTLINFLRAHRNPLEPVLNRMYDGYLKAHHQEKGIESYSEVTAWLIAYRQKYGRL
ncbi:DUF3810 domain-containing protein [Dinghuibacter silviterrae]|uniref:Uncharacterized protein DUF3810 n=1 Tax=Dinghuibacter silviterrae TaxID=1539049 RepID=A0A4R8DGW7_9BACT|nr:DUF3810 domain-containing protein [Dinghuibacter silviterrae]TDW96210.1 uncharacterized protein DUF3810 [Dinghuibacter silviterrae]